MPTIDNAATQTFADGLIRTLPSFVVGNHDDRVLYVGVACFIASPPQTVDSVTFDGVAMDHLVDEVTAGHRVSIWYKIAPTVTTGDIVATASGSIRMKIGAVSVYDTHQTTPHGTPGQASNDASEPATVDVASAIGELVIDFMQAEYGLDSHGAGQTELFLNGDDFSWTSSYEDGATSVTMSEELTGALASWRIVAVPLKPAGPPEPVPMLYVIQPAQRWI